MEQLINKTVKLNVGGTVFKCFANILTTFPDSKLAKLNEHSDAFYFEENEYFFDRNPILFAYILDSFRKGAVHLPKDACGTTFKKELEFWEVSPHYVAPCCWEAFYRSEDDITTVTSLVETFQKNSNRILISEEKLNFRTKVWLFLDEPSSSRIALAWSIFISLVIVAAICADSLATVDAFQENFTQSDIRILYQLGHSIDNATLEKITTMKLGAYLLYVNLLCHAILTIELVLSFVVCKNKKTFVFCFTRLVASFGYLSYWIAIILYLNLKYIGSVHAMIAQFAFQYLSILKLARLFYITRSVPAFRLICLTFASSKQEIKTLVFLLGILVCVFGYIFFAAEFFLNPKIGNIFVAIYWALITLTTVGYGNYTPDTAAGHVIAGACAVCGVLVLALPVGIIVSKYYKYYSFHEYTLLHSKTSNQTHLHKKGGRSSETKIYRSNLIEKPGQVTEEIHL